MATRRAPTPDNRSSEAPRDSEEDVEMGDASEASEVDEEADANYEGGNDMLRTIQKLATYLCTVKEDGEELAAGFQRIPNRRVLPDYFEVISDPIAFSTIRWKTQKKQYNSFSEFVRDVAQICHNAQVYNRPSAPIFGAAVRLREVLGEELEKLLASGEISTEDAKMPDLGELPPAEESPSRSSEERDLDEDDEEEDEDDSEEEDEDDSEDDGGRSRKRRRGRPSISRRRGLNGNKINEAHKKRGRPPMVLTPMEARIASILRGLRKFKDDEGNILILPFEKLPDKTAVADYYQTIANPIALDNIKKKAKRKKYHNVDQVLNDLVLMFENAKTYNEDDSAVYRAAVQLEQQARVLAENEKAKPDDDFRDEDGKLALADIHHNGETWKVGDWVHIRNPNDLGKPIVAQIYRTWQDRAGEKWINTCWYYRPEQTVHRFEKHFYEHEVVKTGQYRDHPIGDVLGRCFVMFVTRFNKGRPRGFPSDKEVYVCESRYNEEQFRFNKIKTWASCVPDEVRERDYEMDLFDVPRQMRKIPSPIKHLLREDAKPTDELPRPTWGSPNAPPIVGAVHRRAPEPNESPPPEHAPVSMPISMAADGSSGTSRRQSMMSVQRDMMNDTPARGVATSFHHQTAPSPSHGQYNTHSMPHFQPATPTGVPPVHQTPVPIPQPPQHHAGAPSHAPVRPIQYQHQPGYAHNYAPGYAPSPTPPMHQQHLANPLTVNYGQGHVPPATRGMVTPATNNVHNNMYNPPRPPEVYTLPDNINDSLPQDLRQGFQHDNNGRVLFFTAPPLDRYNKSHPEGGTGLGHSWKYLAGREEWLAERTRKRKTRDEAANQRPASQNADDLEQTKDIVASQATGAVGEWFRRMDEETQSWTQETGLQGW